MAHQPSLRKNRYQTYNVNTPLPHSLYNWCRIRSLIYYGFILSPKEAINKQVNLYKYYDRSKWLTPLQSSPFRTGLSPNSVEKWELNATFFTSLSQWTLDYPDSTLDRILQRISEAINHEKDYIDLIPDSPFPARSLVLSVAQLIQLSAKISCAQNEVRNFALKIIQWVNRVKESFIEAGNGRFTERTWDNLASMRILIDEICDWAAERLRDRRWSVSNAKIEGEIRDFQSRLNEIEKLFDVQSLIVISGGLDAILKFVSAIFISQYVLMNALQHIHKTQEEHFKHILEEQERQKFLDENLRPYTVRDPTYTAQKKQPCDPDTRLEILDKIQAWIHDHSKASSKNFLWLVGPPGCGKSAITASIVKYCQSHGILGAQFFINRNNHSTTNPNAYFPTVARELATRSDPVERHLYDTLKGQIHSVNTPQEAAKLFVDIVGKAAGSRPDSPLVILFDGLDETRKDSLEDTATIFSQLFASLRKYPNAKILISSRPEDQILKSFKHTPDKAYTAELLINTDDPNCHRDVKAFLKRRLTDIGTRHGLSSNGWPGDNDVEKLADRASGLFIWAVTASNYIDARLRIRGKEILKTVLDQFDNKAMREINTLYRTIINSAYPEDINDEWISETFRRLVGTIMVLREPMRIRDLGALLDLREIPDSDHVDIRNFVENLRTLLVADLDDVTEDTVPRAHKSFFDFITGSYIQDCFRVDIEASNAEMALRCLHQLTNAYHDVLHTHYASKESNLSALSIPIRYSLRFALSHIPEWQRTTLGILSDHPGIMDASQLDLLLHCSSHPNQAGPLIFSAPSNHAFVRTSFDNHSLIWNPEDGSATKAIPLSDRRWILFSPGGTRIFKWWGDKFQCVPEDSYDLSKGVLIPEAPMKDKYVTRDFSFDGTKMAYATGHETILLYSTAPDTSPSKLPNRHQTDIRLLRISQNCSYIASASEKDSVIHIWDTSNDRYINQPGSMRHKSLIECMAFSPDESLFISCDEQHAYVWEIPGCIQKRHSFAFHPGGRMSVAFSPDFQAVLAGSKEGYIFLWNPHTGKQIGEPWKVPNIESDDRARVGYVAFRSCGNIAFACCGRSGYVWNVHQATLITVIPYANTGVFTPDGSQLLYAGWSTFGICNLAPLLLNLKNTFRPEWTTLSPRGNLVVSVARDKILCWRLDQVKVVGNPLKSGPASVNAVTFSTDESRIAGVAEDGTVYLWDSTTRELLSSLPDSVNGVSSLSFTPDGAYIVAKLMDDQSVVLSVVDNILRPSHEDEATCVLQKVAVAPRSTFFDLDKPPLTFGTDPAAPNRRLKDVHWYPSRSDSVAWAYINNHIVRAGKDGSFVVVPVGHRPFIN